MEDMIKEIISINKKVIDVNLLLIDMIKDVDNSKKECTYSIGGKVFFEGIKNINNVNEGIG